MTATMTWISPGDWTAMSNDGTWVLAQTSGNQGLVTTLWSVASAPGVTVDQVLDGMLRQGLDELQGLAIASLSGDDLRLVVRHPAVVRVEVDGEVEVIEAVPGLTWVDTLRAVPDELVLSSDGSEHEGFELPLALGASTAKSLRVDFGVGVENTTAVAAVEPAPGATGIADDATAFLSKEEILAEGAGMPAVEEAAIAEPPLAGPTVFAVRCEHGHLSNPMLANCRVCGTPIPEQKPFEVAQPPLGHIVAPSGDLVAVDHGIVIGRAPVRAPDSDQESITITVSGEISRQHAEVRTEGWNVYIRDLNTTNGTWLTAPGREPLQLRGGEDYRVEPDSEIDLAGVVTLRFVVAEADEVS